MTDAVRRELSFAESPQQVWEAIADSAALADWMYPNDFEPHVGRQFTFQVPGNPKVGFDGLTVECEVLECEPPGTSGLGRLVFSWSAGGAVVDTRVSFRLEPDGAGTRLFFEHAGFDLTHPHGKQALGGANFGWANMLEKLTAKVAAK
jgi:uncharacterized protein YndB with AHSA1/START domain